MYEIKKVYPRLIGTLESWLTTWEDNFEETGEWPIGLERLIVMLKKKQPLTKHYKEVLAFQLWQARYDMH